MILNLPREVRYKIENIILVGVITRTKGTTFTHEFIYNSTSPRTYSCLPRMDNSYQAYNYKICMHTTLCWLYVSDIPATRKLCGFLGHSAQLGCSKCLKKFSTSGFGERMNFARYNRDDWTLRCSSSHKAQCAEFLTANSKTAIQELEVKYGMRYSALVDLPLYDSIRFAAIDPMHNLLLGTAKHMMSLWIKVGILTQQKLQLIQQITALTSFPIDVGRIPNKIGSSFSGFTADQWRIWTTIISPILLRDLIPNDDLKCWLLIVLAAVYCLVELYLLTILNQQMPILCSFVSMLVITLAYQICIYTCIYRSAYLIMDLFTVSELFL